MPISLTFHESQYPARVAEHLRHGLRTRRLPMKFLYDSPAQAQRWLAYHQAYSPSRTEADLLALYDQSFEAALRTVSSDALHVVSLGCGGGRKDARFLQHAQVQCSHLLFTPTDISAALVLETMIHIQEAFPALPCFPYVMDLEAQPDLHPLLAQAEPCPSTRLLSCFGMLPNFDYRTFLPYLRHLMRPHDLLLISANLSPEPYPDGCAAIVPQYDNPFSHAWFAGLLESLGFPLHQLHLTVAVASQREDGHIWQIQAYALFTEPVTLTVYNETFTFAAGEQLHLFFSTRFTPQVMPQVLAHAGLHVIETFLFTSREEGIYVCTGSA
jgi:uncharacterized SAM-dependent methyltransferase